MPKSNQAQGFNLDIEDFNELMSIGKSSGKVSLGVVFIVIMLLSAFLGGAGIFIYIMLSNLT